MPESFLPLQVTGRFGLNTRKRDDALAPGQAVLADGVDLSRLNCAKRRGKRPTLLGSADNVLKGGAPSQSLYVVGEEWWLEHDVAMLEARGDDTATTWPQVTDRRDFVHHRQGVIVIPEGDVTQSRLEVKTGGGATDWAIEFELWTDDLPYLLSRGIAANPAQLSFDTILIAKGRDQLYQWALRAIPDTGGSVNRRYLVLTLYETSDLTKGVDFYYQAGPDRSWIEPGKKIGIAFKFDDAAVTITTKYWIEGSTAVSSSQAVGGTLRTNGVLDAVTNNTAIVVGRRARLRNVDAGATDRREMGFNGCVTELRLWSGDAIAPSGTLTMPSNWFTVASNPPSATDWYVDREIPAEQLSTVDAGSLVQVADLKLYFQFKPELLGTSPTGTDTGDGPNIIRPRYKAGGGTEPRAWVTGADATWVPMAAGSKLGSYALAFIPAAPAGQKFEYANTVRYANPHFAGYRLFCAGIRVPNSDLYLRKVTASASLEVYEWADAYSFDFTFIVDALPSDTANDASILFEICAVRKGPVILADYAVEPVMQACLVFNAGQWRLRWMVKDNAGTEQSIYSTSTIVEGTEYTAGVAVRWETVNGTFRRVMGLYLNGTQEATNTTSPSTKPYLSQVTDSENAGVGATVNDLNDDDQDGRDACYPMTIGYTARTAQAAYNAPVTPFSTRFGSQEQGVADIDTGHRSYWAFHNNLTPKQVNDGVTYHGERGFAGRIGRINVWKDFFLSEDEHRGLVSKAPDEKKVASYGGRLASSWNMEEGQGVYARDRGALGNDLLFNPWPTVKVQTGALARVDRPAILGIWQQRRAELSQSQAPVREVYVLAGGCIHRVATDGNGAKYLDPIGRVLTPELFQPRAKSLRLPTAFEFQGSLFVCTGLGAVKQIIDGLVFDAGVNPVFGNIGDDQTNLGWRELDRDGTFTISATDAAAPSANTVFKEDGVYTWYLTHVNPRTGLESAPSRAMRFVAHNFALSPGNGWDAATLRILPHPLQRHITKMRVYRTTKDAEVDQPNFVREIDVTHTYVDRLADEKLKSRLDSWLNFPPPKNVNIGVAFGPRAYYTGDPANPRRIWYSKIGAPGACPPQYFVDVSDDVTALLPNNGVLLAMSRHKVWALRDSGGEVTFNGNEPLPVSIEPVRSDTGCIGQHAAVLIEKVGWFFASPTGLHLTDGYEFRTVSGDIEPTWRALDLNKTHAFTMLHDSARKRVLILVKDRTAPDDRNDKAIAWHYADLRPEAEDEQGHGGFTRFPTFGAVSCSVIEDDSTGVDRLILGDFSGQVFEFDPPDADIYNDGVASGSTSGTIQDKKLDPLGSGRYTRLKLVTDSSLPTAGCGLRGVQLFTSSAGSAWHSTPALVIVSNDANWVTVESAGAAATDPTGFEWRLGAIGFDWKAGRLPLGSETTTKEASHVAVKFGPSSGAGCLLNVDVGYDDDPVDTGTLDPSKREDEYEAFAGRGRLIQVRFYDTDLPGGRPNNHVEVQEYELGFWPEGRSSYRGSSA